MRNSKNIRISRIPKVFPTNPNEKPPRMGLSNKYFGPGPSHNRKLGYLLPNVYAGFRYLERQCS